MQAAASSTVVIKAGRPARADSPLGRQGRKDGEGPPH